MIKDGLSNNHAELHVISSMYLTANPEQSTDWWKADLATFGLGMAWEVKDSFVPREKQAIGAAKALQKATCWLMPWALSPTGQWEPSRRSENTFNRRTLD